MDMLELKELSACVGQLLPYVWCRHRMLQQISANGPALVSLPVDNQSTVHPPLEEKDFQILQQMLRRPPQVQRCHQPPFSQVWTCVKYVPTANVPSATQKHIIWFIWSCTTRHKKNNPQNCGLALRCDNANVELCPVILYNLTLAIPGCCTRDPDRDDLPSMTANNQGQPVGSTGHCSYHPQPQAVLEALACGISSTVVTWEQFKSRRVGVFWMRKSGFLSRVPSQLWIWTCLFGMKLVYQNSLREWFVCEIFLETVEYICTN